MSASPLVSIVLPTYNGSRYLEQSVQSCIAQTYGNWELIVVDDGSNDETAKIIAGYVNRDQRIRSVTHKRNRGLPAALNTGFANSKGAYLTWTSDDNLYEPEALQLMVNYLEDYPEIAMVCCDVKTIDSAGHQLELWRSLLADEPGGLCIQGCFLYRRRVYESVGDYDEELFLVEDYDYWLRVNRSFRIARLEGVSPYKYRLHRKSLTGRWGLKAKLQVPRAEAKHFAAPHERNNYLANAYWKASRDSRDKGDLRAAWQFALLCVSQRPQSDRFIYWKATASVALRFCISRFLDRIRRSLPTPAKRVGRRILRPIRISKARARLTVGVTPLSYLWGSDRGLSIHRYYLEEFLKEFAHDIQGHCLEFQNPSYTFRIGGAAVEKLDILHIDATNPLATIVADLTKPNNLPSNRFDCIICTHVLHVIAELDRAVSELYRILKPGGVLLVAVPQISMCDPGFHELWRFTPEGLALVLAKAFGKDNVVVKAYGNSLTSAGEIRGLVTHEFNATILNYHDPRFAVEVCARACKRVGTQFLL
jgi:glycosyltransferase involved in cell wall biosynthesis/SAM-dependent methyltransferase